MTPTRERPRERLPSSLFAGNETETLQDSFFIRVSSIIMSLNSLDSKISPHSMHSTNSASSSRATICTRGCLHSFMVLLFSGGCDGGIEVINPDDHGRPGEAEVKFAGNWRYFSLTDSLVKSFRRKFGFDSFADYSPGRSLGFRQSNP